MWPRGTPERVEARADRLSEYASPQAPTRYSFPACRHRLSKLLLRHGVRFDDEQACSGGVDARLPIDAGDGSRGPEIHPDVVDWLENEDGVPSRF